MIIFVWFFYFRCCPVNGFFFDITEKCINDDIHGSVRPEIGVRWHDKFSEEYWELNLLNMWFSASNQNTKPILETVWDWNQSCICNQAVFWHISSKWISSFISCIIGQVVNVYLQAEYLFLWAFWSDVERSVVCSQADRPEQDDEHWGVEQDQFDHFVFTRIIHI